MSKRALRSNAPRDIAAHRFVRDPAAEAGRRPNQDSNMDAIRNLIERAAGVQPRQLGQITRGESALPRADTTLPSLVAHADKPSYSNAARCRR